MENPKNIVYFIVSEVITSYSLEVNKNIEFNENTTRLIGNTSPFDSSDLVQLIVEIEDRINEKFGTDITLTDEKAMSRSTSPFSTVETLVNFIIEKLM